MKLNFCKAPNTDGPVFEITGHKLRKGYVLCDEKGNTGDEKGNTGDDKPAAPPPRARKAAAPEAPAVVPDVFAQE